MVCVTDVTEIGGGQYARARVRMEEVVTLVTLVT